MGKENKPYKLLYKMFKVNSSTGNLMGPYSSKDYWSNNNKVGSATVLTMENYKNWESSEVGGRLIACHNGFHAFSSDQAEYFISKGRKVFRIRLYNAKAVGGKYVGSKFKILYRVSIKVKHVKLGNRRKSACGVRNCCMYYPTRKITTVKKLAR